MIKWIWIFKPTEHRKRSTESTRSRAVKPETLRETRYVPKPAKDHHRPVGTLFCFPLIGLNAVRCSWAKQQEHRASSFEVPLLFQAS